MRLRWYVDRARRMSFREALHRVLGLGRSARLALGPPNLVPEALDIGFLSGRVRIPLPAVSEPPSEPGPGMEGWEWSPDDPLVWRRAPDTGRVWPLKPWYLVQHRPGNPVGDARLVWEPSRLHHLVPLALRASDEGMGPESTWIDAQLVHWYRQNPAYRGPHYTSAMECGLRILSVAICYEAIRGAASPALERILPTWIAEHAWFIERSLSLYSSAGNHTIAEAAGLLVAGLTLPEVRHAYRWRARGRGLLESEARRQILPDGGGVEQAPAYLRFVSDLIAYAAACLRHVGDPSHDLESAVGRAESFLDAISPAGALPPIGDADGGRGLGRGVVPRRVRGEAAGSAAASPEGPSVRTFFDAGMTVVSCCRPARMHVLFDHGPLGMAPGYGHGHADALQVLVWWGGHWRISELGCSTYGGDPRRRALERSMEAHSTIQIRGLDGRSAPAGAFLWSSPYRARLLLSQPMPGREVLLVAEHDGYPDVTPRRAVIAGPGWLAVHDEARRAIEGTQTVARWVVGPQGLGGLRVSAFRGVEPVPLEPARRPAEVSRGYAEPRAQGTLLDVSAPAGAGPILTIIESDSRAPDPRALLRRVEESLQCLG